MVLDSLDSSKNSIVVVTSEVDSDKSPIVVSIRSDGSGKYNSLEFTSNFVTSIHGRDNFLNFITNSVNSGNVLYVNEEKSRKLNSEAKVQFFGALSNIDFDIIIRQTNAVVNSKLQKIGERNSIYIKDGHTGDGKTVDFIDLIVT